MYTNFSNGTSVVKLLKLNLFKKDGLLEFNCNTDMQSWRCFWSNGLLAKQHSYSVLLVLVLVKSKVCSLWTY